MKLKIPNNSKIFSVIFLIAIFAAFVYAQSISEDKLITDEMQASVTQLQTTPEKYYPKETVYPLAIDSTIKPEIAGAAAAVYDIAQDKFLYEKDIDTERPIASLTKLMTAFIIDKYGEYDDTFIVGDYALSTEARAGYLHPGEELTIKNLISTTLMESSNDGAVSLSEYLVKKNAVNQDYDFNDVTTSQDREQIFVKLMNKEASQMKMFNTKFKDPHGLNDTEAYSTIRDINNLFNIFIDNPILLETISTTELAFQSIDGQFKHYSKNTHELLGNTEGVLAGKTGFTYNANQCLITLWSHNTDKEFIITILGSNDRFGETKALIDWLNQSFKWTD